MRRARIIGKVGTVPGVVAMRYNGYVDTAARFVEDLYQRLAASQ
jgi:hypothetical protein